MLTLVATLPTATADEVVLNNGSIIVGTLQRVNGKQITLATDFAGVLSIDQARVVALGTDQPWHVRPGNGPDYFGRVQHLDGATTVQTTDGPQVIVPATLVAMWSADGLSPEAVAAAAAAVPPATSSEKTPDGAKWNGELAFDLTGKSGSSNRLSIGGSLRAERKTAQDRLLLYARGIHTESEGKTTAEEFKLGAEYEHNLTERQNWYVRTELEYDEPEDLEYRATLGAGYGYYFIKNAPRDLLGRVGLVVTDESYNSGEDDQRIGLDLSLQHRWQFAKWGLMRNKIGLVPSLDDPSDYRAEHESSLDLALSDKQNWTLRLGLSNQYDSKPNGSNEQLDTTYFARLVYKWQ